MFRFDPIASLRPSDPSTYRGLCAQRRACAVILVCPVLDAWILALMHYSWMQFSSCLLFIDACCILVVYVMTKSAHDSRLPRV